MKRKKKYDKLRNLNSDDLQLNYLRNQCYKLVDRVLALGEIKKQDLFAALAIRLRIPINECYIKKFDAKMLEKAIKELNYML